MIVGELLSTPGLLQLVTRWPSGLRRQHRRVSATWLNQRAVDGYTATIYRESMSLLKALSEATKGGTIPVNPQVRCNLV